ncbi:MAG: haloalkane dehalogenase [Acidobacteriota bacterium]
MSDDQTKGREVRPGVIRTPDECFDNLAGFPFQPNYVEVNHYRVHYLDEGPPDVEAILLMHGEPSWCYLYRKMIPVLVEAGYRCIAPDLIGFGRSDKLIRRDDYSYQFHVDIVNAFVKALNLDGVTLFGQDWGGLIGLRVLADNPERFVRLIVANTGLPTGDHKASDGFLRWKEYSQSVKDFHVGGIVNGGCVTKLSAEVIAAYDAPFPDDSYKEGARVFPTLVPITPDDPASAANRHAWEVLQRWSGKVLTLFSDRDAVTAGGQKPFEKLMSGARDEPHTIIEDAGHFLQEDKGEVIAQKIVTWLSGL